MTFPALTDGQIEAFRRTYIRDLAVAASGPTPSEYLSRYNNDTKANFFSDADIRAFDAKNIALYGRSLATMWDDTKQEYIDAQESETDATAAADVMLLDARLRLVRIDAYTTMMHDPKYRACMMVGSDPTAMNAVFEVWNKTIGEDLVYRTWGEGGGGVYSIRLVRR